MWYFSWVLGLGFAVTLAVLNAMWLEIGVSDPAAFSQGAFLAPPEYDLVCLPLKYPNLDGAPARAVLLEG